MRNDLTGDMRRMLVNDLFIEVPPDRIGLDDGFGVVATGWRRAPAHEPSAR